MINMVILKEMVGFFINKVLGGIVIVIVVVFILNVILVIFLKLFLFYGFVVEFLYIV